MSGALTVPSIHSFGSSVLWCMQLKPGAMRVGCFGNGSTLPAIKKPLFLVSDLDDTLIGGAHSQNARDEHTAVLRDILTAGRSSGHVPVRLAINTGRTLPLFEVAARHKAHCLPQPDAVIAGVGTRVYYAATNNGSSGWVEDTEWTAAMHHNWSHSAVSSIVNEAVSSFGDESIFWQPAVEQNDHKCTFLYRTQLRDTLSQLLASGLGASGIKATVIEGPSGRGPDWRFVDVLPERAGKGAAMEWVRARLGFDPDHTVACGDGPNDMLMLQQARVAICVGNSQPEVQDWVKQLQQQQQHMTNASYGTTNPADARSASSGPRHKRVHLASPNAHAAAGILEGLAAFGFIA